MSDPLRVLLISTSYPRDEEDWKGRFIFDQADALARQGAKLKLWAPPGKLPSGAVSALADGDALFLKELLSRGGIAHLLRQRPWAGAWAGYQLLRRIRSASRRATDCEVYLINWLQNALSLPDDDRPAIVTVLGSDYALLRLPGICAALRRQFRRRRVLLAPNAGWMTPHLQSLFGDVAQVDAIPFGVAKE